MVISAKEAVDTLIALGFSQNEIARRIGVSQPTIHRIYVGKQRGANWSTILQLSLLLEQVRPTRRVGGRKMA